jgi:fructose PTS system EIIBC or EIIC component
MAKIVAVTACPAGIAHTLMAAEALRRVAADLGHQIAIEAQGSAGGGSRLTAPEIEAADVVLIASDVHVDLERFTGKPILAVTTSQAIRKTRAVLESAVLEARVAEPEAPKAAPEAAGTPAPPHEPQFLVAVTACPTGIAHTFMAAEALRKAAEVLGHRIKVETQGSVGARNVLTAEEIEQAAAVVIAADAYVDTSRFAGRPLYQTTTKAALHDGAAVLRTALSAPAAAKAGYVSEVEELKRTRSSQRSGPYRHLMTGVSYMLPVVVAGGLLIALGFAVGGIYAADAKGTLGWSLMEIGGGTAFTLFVPVLAGFIAFSIAERPGLTPGLIGGMLAAKVGAGFLGGIAAGFLAGYLTKALNDGIRLPEHLQGLKPVLILPVLSTLITGLLLIYVVGPPVKTALDALTAWLQGMQERSALVLGALLGGMMAFDMGGPVNKAAYTFAVGLLSSKVYGPMAAVMAAGMTPPLGLALAATFFRSRFTTDEREASKAAYVLGISFITEGAIPFAARDPLRVIPCIVLGSAVTGALSMVSGVQLLVPHGGVFVLLIPNAVTGLLAYAGAIVAGSTVTAVSLGLVKRPVM